MNPNQPTSRHHLSTFIFLLALGNLLVLDLFIVNNFLGKKNNQVSQAVATSIPVSTVPVNSASCSSGCLTAINEATSSLKLAEEKSSLPTSKNIAAQPEINEVKEFFVPLGTGSSTALDWTNIPGTIAEINDNNYNNIKQVLFETSVRVPDANQIVEVRLYNATDNYVVANSVFLYPSGTTENFRIAAIQLGQGAKTYQVQMKTQLGQTAILDQARIHITTN